MTLALKHIDETALSDRASNFRLCLSHMIWFPIILYKAVTLFLSLVKTGLDLNDWLILLPALVNSPLQTGGEKNTQPSHLSKCLIELNVKPAKVWDKFSGVDFERVLASRGQHRFPTFVPFTRNQQLSTDETAS